SDLNHLKFNNMDSHPKIILPPERDFVLIGNKKAHFFVLGWICSLKLMGMGYRHIAIKLTKQESLLL
ncbi:hypothetical protein P4U30_15740, partial [Bacillus mycoides]|nr:hypothetical protein [Bacillus mycoides]